MMVQELTPQAVTLIFAGTNPSEQFQPIVIVKDVKVLSHEPKRWRLLVADYELLTPSVVMNDEFSIELGRGRVVPNTVVRLTAWQVTEVQQSMILLIQSAEVLGEASDALKVLTPRKYKHGSGIDSSQTGPIKTTCGNLGMSRMSNSSHYNSADNTTPTRTSPHDFEKNCMTPLPVDQQTGFGGVVTTHTSAPPFIQQAGTVGSMSISAAPVQSATSPYTETKFGDFHGGRSGKAPVQQFSQRSTNMFLPISELSPYCPKGWKIRARITSKSDVRKFSNARGEGQLFKVDLQDKSGEVQATFFGRGVDTYFSRLQANRIYTFKRGSVKAANPRFDRGQYVVTFDEQTEVEDQEEDTEIPGVSYLFLPIAQVLATPNTGSMVDVSGVVSSVQETMLMIVKTGAMSGQERPKRSFTLWDNSGDEGGTHMEITLWGDKAHMDLQVGGVLFVKGARTGEWQNRVTLNTAGTTGVEVNPDHPRTFELTRQWQAAGSPSGAFIFASTHSATGAGGSAGGIGYKPGGAGMVVQTVEQCLEEDVNLVSPLAQGQGFNPNMGRDMHRHVVLCTLTGVQTERPPFYAACPETVERTGLTQAPEGTSLPRRTCNKKVMEEGGLWRCAAGHSSSQPLYRYLCRVQLTDHTGNLDATIFDESGVKLFGSDANAIASLWNGGGQEAAQEHVQQMACWKTCAMRLRAQKENFNSEDRVKYVIMELADIPLVAEARERLSQIKSAIGGF